MLLISQMGRQFCLQRPLYQRFGQLLQRPVLAYEIFWLLILRQQLVDQSLIHLHTISCSINEDRLHKMTYTLRLMPIGAVVFS